MADFAQPLREEDADPDPLAQFGAWLGAAGDAGVRAPEAVALATATPDGAPSLRMVLLKGYDERGFAFFSNYESRKGTELLANPRAALLFHWDALGRQVRIEGPVERIPREESDAYIRTRTRGSQLSALASPQSRPVESRTELERLVARRSRSCTSAGTCRFPSSGAASAFGPSATSSGSTARIASTTGCSTPPRRVAAGPSSGWLRRIRPR